MDIEGIYRGSGAKNDAIWTRAHEYVAIASGYDESYAGIRGFSTYNVSDLMNMEYVGETVFTKPWFERTRMGTKSLGDAGYRGSTEHNIEVQTVGDKTYLLKSSYNDGVTIYDATGDLASIGNKK